jgi:hypothetical protein
MGVPERANNTFGGRTDQLRLHSCLLQPLQHLLAATIAAGLI